eukprot:TRINITY_DN10159_c0_g1_i1.p3 TRINITY_DN10159_c0_g1~~TRINITY_DN10159_c0_g1_i1.p3  ORF type:complete len:242 (+),score=49.98 TRINITY_DN10159_c0_g1_i1:21-746(+)
MQGFEGSFLPDAMPSMFLAFFFLVARAAAAAAVEALPEQDDRASLDESPLPEQADRASVDGRNSSVCVSNRGRPYNKDNCDWLGPARGCVWDDKEQKCLCKDGGWYSKSQHKCWPSTPTPAPPSPTPPSPPPTAPIKPKKSTTSPPSPSQKGNDRSLLETLLYLLSSFTPLSHSASAAIELGTTFAGMLLFVPPVRRGARALGHGAQRALQAGIELRRLRRQPALADGGGQEPLALANGNA